MQGPSGSEIRGKVVKSAATKLQDRHIKGVCKSIDEGRDAFFQGPTGVGKTRTFSVIAEKEVEKDKSVIVFAATKLLVSQNQNAFKRWASKNIETTYGMDGNIDQSGQIVYSTIQTAHDQRDELRPYDVAVFDEAHHARADNPEYTETFDALIRANPEIRFVGVSATPPPEYLGMHPRLKDADKHVITYAEAIEAKLIDLPETILPPMHLKNNDNIRSIVDRHRKAKTSAALETGISKELGELRGDDWNHQLVNVYERHLKDRKTLGYFDTIKEATEFAVEAKERGHEPALIHSRLSDKHNKKAIEDFKSGASRLLLSIDMIGEGLDVDADGVLLDKRSTSRQEYEQINGRQSRSHGVDKPVKSRLVDTGASTYIHGEMSALAEMQNIRGGIERLSLTGEALLPDMPSAKFQGWVEMKSPDKGQSVWGTSVDGKIVYAMPTTTGYAAFESTRNKKGARVDLLTIEGERKGLPSREAMGRWFSDAVRRNERPLGQMLGRVSAGVTELARMVDEDWRKNARSIERSIGVLTSGPIMAHTQRQAMSR